MFSFIEINVIILLSRGTKIDNNRQGKWQVKPLRERRLNAGNDIRRTKTDSH